MQKSSLHAEEASGEQEIWQFEDISFIRKAFVSKMFRCCLFLYLVFVYLVLLRVLFWDYLSTLAQLMVFETDEYSFGVTITGNGLMVLAVSFAALWYLASYIERCMNDAEEDGNQESNESRHFDENHVLKGV